MADFFIERQIGTLPQFNRLNNEQRGQVANITQMLRFQRGQLIFRQNDPTRGMYFVVSGSAQLVQVDANGQPQQVGIVGALQYLNEAALIQPGIESAALRTLEDTLVLLIPHDQLVALLAQRPDIARAIPLPIQIPQRPQQPPGYQQPAQPTQPAGQQPYQPPAQPTQPAGQRPYQPPAQPTQPAGQRPYQPPGYQQPDPRQPGIRDRTPGPRTGNQPGQQIGYQQPGQPAQRPTQPVPDGGLTPRGPSAPRGPKVFRSQRDDEDVLLDTRRHIWVIIVKLWLPALVLVPFVVLSVTGLPFGLTFALDGIGVVIAALIVLYYYLEWRNDHLIVTDQRVVHIERTILTLEISISEVPLISVQEINADLITANPFSRLLDFGTIELKTAGSAGNIKFTVIPHPDRVQDIIFENRERQRYSVDIEHQENIREDVHRAIKGETDESTTPLPGVNQMPARPVRKTSLLGWMRSYNDKGETIYRKHLLLWAQRVFWPAIITFFGLIVIALGIFTALGVVGLLVGAALTGMGAFIGYWADWDWRHDTYVIGHDTIKIIHKRPFWLQNENDQIRVERIDNVVSEQGGVFENLFNYGNVRISLLGGDIGDAKYFRYVPNPQEVQAEVTRRQERLRQRGNLLEEQRRRDEIAEYLSVYHEEFGGDPAGQPPAPGQDQQGQQPYDPYRGGGNFPRR